VARLARRLYLFGMTKEPGFFTVFDTALGPFGLAWRERGIVRMLLPQRDVKAMERRLAAHFDATQTPPPAIERLIEDVRRYSAGERVCFDDTAVDLGGVDAFRLSVYAAARAIPFGATRTYGDLARAIGSPNAAREVGQALGQNPVPVIIPCHRILAAGGRIGGFSAPGGSVTKERLLALEGLRFEGGRSTSQGAFDFTAA
jgi:methylated-DNA-[protein]-cysteine S-methyltransferase